MFPYPALRPHEQQPAGDHLGLRYARGNLPDADSNRGAADFQIRFLQGQGRLLHGQQGFLYGERSGLEFSHANLWLRFRWRFGISCHLVRCSVGFTGTTCADVIGAQSGGDTFDFNQTLQLVDAYKIESELHAQPYFRGGTERLRQPVGHCDGDGRTPFD